MSSTCDSTELETSLEWVTFSEEDHGEPCQNISGCSNEAVYRVKWLNNCCHGDSFYCSPCMSTPVARRALSGERGRCRWCKGPQQLVSVSPIGRK